MKTSTILEPDTIEAWLVPNVPGIGRRATLHRFKETTEVVIQYPTGPKRAHAFMFECLETGAVRRWGYTK